MTGFNQEMEYSVHAPNSFIKDNLNRILPAWTCPVRSVLLVLQRSPLTLLHRTKETEAIKNQLRQDFFIIAETVSIQLREEGYCAEIFEPRNGLPTCSQSGDLCLSDVATAHTLLRYPVYRVGGCTLLMHPRWGSEVYPSTLVSSAPPEALNEIASETFRHLRLKPAIAR